MGGITIFCLSKHGCQFHRYVDYNTLRCKVRRKKTTYKAMHVGKTGPIRAQLPHRKAAESLSVETVISARTVGIITIVCLWFSCMLAQLPYNVFCCGMFSSEQTMWAKHVIDVCLSTVEVTKALVGKFRHFVGQLRAQFTSLKWSHDLLYWKPAWLQVFDTNTP